MKGVRGDVKIKKTCELGKDSIFLTSLYQKKTGTFLHGVFFYRSVSEIAFLLILDNCELFDSAFALN